MSDTQQTRIENDRMNDLVLERVRRKVQSRRDACNSRISFYLSRRGTPLAEISKGYDEGHYKMDSGALIELDSLLETLDGMQRIY
jgi:hypothetical protein